MDTDPNTPKAADPSLQDKIDFFLLSAHELRTSLSAMKWLFKMLYDGDYGTLTADQEAAVYQAIQANQRMVDLLNNTMTSIKNNEFEVYAKLPVNINVLMADIAQEFTNEAAHKKIAITYHQPPIEIIVRGDAGKLRIALHNIVENAIKYSDANTEIIISLEVKGDNSIITVQDHGVGIPEDKKPHIFEKFFRAENTLQQGTGLGLYSTKHIIEQHGGSIIIQSTEHQGTTVIISLPLEK